MWSAGTVFEERDSAWWTGKRYGTVTTYYTENGFKAGETVIDGDKTRITKWRFDGTVFSQLEGTFDSHGNVVDMKVNNSPPWWWGVTNQTEPTAPWWGKE